MATELTIVRTRALTGKEYERQPKQDQLYNSSDPAVDVIIAIVIRSYVDGRLSAWHERFHAARNSTTHLTQLTQRKTVGYIAYASEKSVTPWSPRSFGVFKSFYLGTSALLGNVSDISGLEPETASSSVIRRHIGGETTASA